MNKSQKTQQKTTAQKVTKRPKSNLKLEFKWKHMNQRNEYKLIRAANGGGVRGVSVPRTADAKSCIQLAKDLFFENGESSKGKLEDMDFELGDYKGNVIDTSDKSFTVASYKRMYGLHSVRLVLLSKDKNNETEDKDDDESGFHHRQPSLLDCL
jgi:hypothetical protein